MAPNPNGLPDLDPGERERLHDLIREDLRRRPDKIGRNTA